MLAFVRGQLVAHNERGLIVEVGGLGYFIFATSDLRQKLVINQDVKLFVYEQIKDDRHDLYGFLDLASRSLFELLLTVNGVGPRLALAILEIGPVKMIQQAISRADKDYLILGQGVGQRLAERLIVELRSKLEIDTSDDQPDWLAPRPEDEAVNALKSLGWSRQEAHQALKGVDRSLPTNQQVAWALKSQI